MSHFNSLLEKNLRLDCKENVTRTWIESALKYITTFWQVWPNLGSTALLHQLFYHYFWVRAKKYWNYQFKKARALTVFWIQRLSCWFCFSCFFFFGLFIQCVWFSYSNKKTFVTLFIKQLHDRSFAIGSNSD